MKSRLNTLKNKITALFRQGLTPKEIALSIIVSGLIGIIPVLGVSTFMITTLSLKSKLNLPIMIAFNYLIWPVQILLIIPFIRIGEFIFFVQPNHHTIEEIISSFHDSFFRTLSHLSFELLYGLGGWFFTAVPASFGIYLLRFLFLKESSIIRTGIN